VQQNTTPRPSQQDSDVEVTIFTAGKPRSKYKAKGRLTGDGKTFEVFAGSTIADTPKILDAVKEKREALQKIGVIKDCKFEKNYVFRSANEAAHIIRGVHVSAYDTWDGLKEFLDGGGDDTE